MLLSEVRFQRWTTDGNSPQAGLSYQATGARMPVGACRQGCALCDMQLERSGKLICIVVLAKTSCSTRDAAMPTEPPDESFAAMQKRYQIMTSQPKSGPAQPSQKRIAAGAGTIRSNPQSPVCTVLRLAAACQSHWQAAPLMPWAKAFASYLKSSRHAI